MSKALLIIATLGIVVAAFIVSTHNYNVQQARGDASQVVPPSAPIHNGDVRVNDAEMQSYCNRHPSQGLTAGVCRFTRRGRVVFVPIDQ
jgi:hypothetical protein